MSAGAPVRVAWWRMIRALALASALLAIATCQDLYELNVFHYNDFHARFVETSPSGGVCAPETAPCIGGFARLTSAVRAGLQREPQSLLLNAGDSFQGTIWYNLLRWNVTQEFMNILPHDAHVLGNHEFDNGIEGVVPYLEHLDSVTVTANIIDDLEPSIQGKYQPSVVVERNGRRIGIIGVILATTNELASTGQLVFTDEVTAVRREAELLAADGVDIIIVLSHCGIDIDREIAIHGGPHIDLVVGGHSHTLLYTGDAPGSTQPGGPYPLIVEQTDGRQVPIVQASCHTEYLGEIKLFFDDSGEVQGWQGEPIYLGNDVEQAEDVLARLAVYSGEVDALAQQEVGYSRVELSSSCACGECNLGNFICDAFMHATMERAESGNWHYAHFCVINQGGIRSSIPAGTVTYEAMLLSTPFENVVEVFDLRGDHIMEMLEYSVTNEPYVGARTLQLAGMRLEVNGTAPMGARVANVRVRCVECDVPRYEPLALDRYYKVVSQSFLAGGGDGFTSISNNRVNVEVIGVDNVLLQEYLEHQSPVVLGDEWRMRIADPCLPN